MDDWYFLYKDASIEVLKDTLRYMKRDIQLAEMAPDVSLPEKLSYIKEMKAGIKVVSNLLEREAS